ncbi:MAG: protein Mom [Acidobacteriota bacterium]
MQNLRLDFCSHQAAKHAVMRWHYSRAMPAAKLVRIGVWEDGRFSGVILYGSGANRHLASPFGLEPTEACELVRVALAPARKYPTSRCLAISLKMLRRQSPGLRLIVSYADTKEGHLGVIYQATNWIYLGAGTQPYLKIRGKIEHPRSLYERYGRGGQQLGWLRKHVDPNAERVEMPAKLKYVYCLDRSLRPTLEAAAQPYPKRVESIDDDAPGDQPGEGGSSPTSTLHSPAP